MKVGDGALVFFHCKADASYFRCINKLSPRESMTAGPQSRKSEEEVTHIWISAGQSCPAAAGVTWRHDGSRTRPESLPFACVVKMSSVCLSLFVCFVLFSFVGGGVLNNG